jgi:hypothetical protein
MGRHEIGGASVNDRRPMQLSRAELYELVWSLPLKTLAARHGVSDVALAKLCRRRQVLVPPRGYWAKKRSGQIVARPALAEFVQPVKVPKAPQPATASNQLPEPQPAPSEPLAPPGNGSNQQSMPYHPLSAHTVVLVRAAVGWSETEQLEQLFRLPVIGFFTDAGDMGAYGTCHDVAPDERRKMARSIYDLYEMVASPDVPADIAGFVEGRIKILRLELARLERANRSDDDGRRLDAADAIRREAESLALTLYTRDATIEDA